MIAEKSVTVAFEINALVVDDCAKAAKVVVLLVTSSLAIYAILEIVRLVDEALVIHALVE